MRIGLVGDIHGNSLALKAVLDSARSLKVERLLITGDLVGYYFSPKEVLEMLSPWDKIVVRGNHEEMLKKARRSKAYLLGIERRYGIGLRIAIDSLNWEQINWLESLPHPQEIKVEDCRILLCHGSPWDPDLYVYPDHDISAIGAYVADKFEWVVLGHTHYPMQRMCGNVSVVNPGSVGQARNKKPGAYWALLDTETKSCTQRIESYDLKQVIIQSKTLQPHLPYLWNVLATNEDTAHYSHCR